MDDMNKKQRTKMDMDKVTMILRRWEDEAIPTDSINRVPIQFAKNDIEDLSDAIRDLRTEIARLDTALADAAAQLTDAVQRVAELEAELREARGNTQQQAIIDQAKQTLSIENLAAHWEIEKLRKLDQSAKNYNRMANLSWYVKGLGTGYDLLNQPIADDGYTD